jgi:hypothetical protein
MVWSLERKHTPTRGVSRKIIYELSNGGKLDLSVELKSVERDGIYAGKYMHSDATCARDSFINYNIICRIRWLVDHAASAGLCPQ